MRILVTGAAGFVGAHLARRIGERFGDAVIVATDIIAPDAAAISYWQPISGRVQFRSLDVRDRAAVAGLIREVGPTHVVHAAAVTPSNQQELDQPAQILDVNLAGTVNVVDATTAQPGLVRLVAFSSAAVYGNDPDLPDPVMETQNLRPTGLYGIAKAAGEAIVTRYAALGSVSCVNVRVAGAYGPLERPSGSRARMSQVHRLAEALSEGRAISVHGPDVPRDWVHADDVGDAVAGLLAAQALDHDVYNIGSGRAIGWHETVRLFRDAGLQVTTAARAEDADIALAASEGRAPLSIARLAAQTGYAPRTLAAGLASLLPAVNHMEAAR